MAAHELPTREPTCESIHPSFATPFAQPPSGCGAGRGQAPGAAGIARMSRIYLVDDQLILRDGLQALLEAAGHDVVGASSDPTQCVVESQQRQADVMLLDLGLGERSGFEVLQELKRRQSAVRTVVLTMSAQPRHVAEAVRLGAMAYVLKDSGAPESFARSGGFPGAVCRAPFRMDGAHDRGLEIERRLDRTQLLERAIRGLEIEPAFARGGIG